MSGRTGCAHTLHCVLRCALTLQHSDRKYILGWLFSDSLSLTVLSDG